MKGRAMNPLRLALTALFCVAVSLAPAQAPAQAPAASDAPEMDTAHQNHGYQRRRRRPL